MTVLAPCVCMTMKSTDTELSVLISLSISYKFLFNPISRNLCFPQKQTPHAGCLVESIKLSGLHGSGTACACALTDWSQCDQH